MSWRDCGPPAPCCWARPTWTRARWAPPRLIRILAPPTIRSAAVIPLAVRRVVQPLRWPPGWRWRRLGRTAWAPCASRPVTAAFTRSSRPMGKFPLAAWCRPPVGWMRWACWLEVWTISPCCCRFWPATTPMTHDRAAGGWPLRFRTGSRGICAPGVIPDLAGNRRGARRHRRVRPGDGPACSMRWVTVVRSIFLTGTLAACVALACC